MTLSTKRLGLGLALLLLSLALASTAHADRRSSLAGNLLIEDTDDVFFFPHEALKHVRLVSVDFATTASASPGVPGDDAIDSTGGGLGEFGQSAGGTLGNALGIFGSKDFAFGFATHRSELVNTLPGSYYGIGDVGTLNGARGSLWPLNTGGTLPPTEWIDLIAAMPMGGNTLGVRLSISHAHNDTENKRGDIENASANSVNLLLGYGLNAAGFDMDLAAELSLGLQNHLDDDDGDKNNVETNTDNIPSISLMARGTKPMAKGVKLGVLGLLSYQNATSVTETQQNDSKSGTARNMLLLDLGAGPVYQVNDKFTIAAYGTVGVQYRSFDPETNSDNKNDQTSALVFVLPKLKLSGEFQALDWLVFRTGVDYTYVWTSQSYETKEDDNSAKIKESSNTANAYYWVTGVGIQLDELSFNGTFNAPFVLNGPSFIGGDTRSNMFAMLNMTYDFE